MIRPYQDSDWPMVCAVYDQSKPRELASAGVEASFTPLADDPPRIADFHHSDVHVFEENGRILGFAGRRGDYISWLYVAPNHFRRGIGRALLRELMSRIAGQPWLWSMKGNYAAISLYESEGFRIVEERTTQNRGMSAPAVKLERPAR